METLVLDDDIVGYMYEPEYDSDEVDVESTESESDFDNCSAEESSLVESDEGDDRDEELPTAGDRSRLSSLSWCTCGHCEIMPTVKESRCCHEIAVLVEQRQNVKCVTELRNLRMICLEPAVLSTAYVQFHIYKRRSGLAPDELTNR